MCVHLHQKRPWACFPPAAAPVHSTVTSSATCRGGRPCAMCQASCSVPRRDEMLQASLGMHDYLSISSTCVASTPHLCSSLALPELICLAVGAQSSRHKGLHKRSFPESVLEVLFHLLAARILTGRSLTAHSLQALSKQQVLLRFFLLMCQ